MSTRSKIYNKMVQMLECKGVRDSIGCHWKDWVSQENTRLARARDEASQRCLTRAEVTFYCQNDIPSDEIMEATLKRIVQYVEASLVYTTPYACVWNTYCDDSYLPPVSWTPEKRHILRVAAYTGIVLSFRKFIL